MSEQTNRYQLAIIAQLGFIVGLLVGSLIASKTDNTSTEQVERPANKQPQD
jgi:hypothetical protein